jgi:hypothetical protein
MPYAPPDSSGQETIVYPTEHMREVAAKILAKASNRQFPLDTTWNQIQQWIYETVDKHWQQAVLDMLTPYVKRLNDSFDWQSNLAGRIFDIVDAIEGNEQNTSLSFTPPGHGPTPF